MSSYKGILQHINGLHLWQTITGMNKFSDFNIKSEKSEITERDGKRFFNVPMIGCELLTDKKIIVLDYVPKCTTKNGPNRTFVLINDNGKKYKFYTNNSEMKDSLNKISENNGFPFETTIKMSQINSKVKNYYFT